MPGGWFFRGGCAESTVTRSDGGLFTLEPYRGIAASIKYPQASADTLFIIGDALGTDDIAGKLDGWMGFPAYGTVPCLTPDRTAVDCPGSALLYLDVVNQGNVGVDFRATPSITMWRRDGFGGVRSCELATMISPSGESAAWLMRPVRATPVGTRLRFEPVPAAQHYAGGGAFTAFAVICEKREPGNDRKPTGS